MKNSYNREILINMVLKKLKYQFLNKKLPAYSKLLVISKIITTDIISSFEVKLNKSTDFKIF